MHKKLALLWAFILTASLYAQGPSQEGPSALSGMFYKAETYRITGRTELAMELYETLAKDPVYRETALYQLARMHFDQNQFFESFNLATLGAESYPTNLWLLRMKAQSAKSIGDFKTAASAFKALFVLAPHQPEYLFETYNAYLEGGLFSEAIEALSAIETFQGSSPELVQDRARLFLQLNDPKSAERCFKNAVKAFPNIAEYSGLLSQYYDGNGKVKKAYKVLTAAVETFPDNGALHMELARMAQKLEDTETAMYHMEQGLLLQGVSLEDKMPVLLSIYENRANPSFQAMFDRIFPVFNDQYSDRIELHVLAAQIHIQNERWDEALESCFKAIAKNPTNYSLYQMAFSLNQEMDAFDGQIAVLESIEENFQEEEEILESLVFEYYNMEQWSSSARLADERAKKILDPERAANLHALAGSAWFQLDSFELGARAYDKALGLVRNATALNNYAWDLATHELHLELALQLTTESNALVALEPTFLDTWAWVLYKMGRYAEAQAKIELALQLLKEADRVGIYLHAAKIEQALGNEEKAKIYRMKEAVLKQL
ncbi:MAG: tetratricopeptide repeat protein [Schleiferiaceae bacterium]|nr:tetratricopeptide repeat protein [Schleiferiaceae bacterium]